MKIYGETNVGFKRKNNQDTYRNKLINDNFGWSLVCDGMGGVNGGDVASNLSAETVEEYLDTELNENLSDEEILQMINVSFQKANSAVWQKAIETKEYRGMGTTAVLAIIKGNKLLIGHIGDSRAYLFSDNNISQITTDHSYVQNLVNHGQLTKDEARFHPQKNIITKSLGVHSSVDPEINSYDLKAGDKIIICTDGLGDYLTDKVLNEYVANTDDEKLPVKLINFALRCGGVDNVTVTTIVIEG